MADVFLRLSASDRLEILGRAADKSGRAPRILEKDAWVVWTLSILYGSALGEHLVFKGGTSLSKAYGAIRRFSEDVDLTHDIRAIAPDLVGDRDESLPRTRSEAKRWSSKVRKRLSDWVEGTVQPIIVEALTREELAATVRIEGEKLYVDYEATVAGSGTYVAPEVLLEFGARSTGEPASPLDIVCDASSFVEGVVFPTARPRVMHAQRTFWEKVTAIHVFCLQERVRGERFARHWHDVVRMDEAGLAEAAFADRDLANAVARHKALFFVEKAADRRPIDYVAAVNGGLCLVPAGEALKALGDDYARMVDAQMIFDDAESLETLMERCADIAERANRGDRA